MGFLGMVIGPERIKIEEEKVKGVLEWLTLAYIKDIQKFLGLANYYCQFIESFAAIARPLYDMVKKNKKWDWTEKQEKMFRELKEKFTKESVLAVLDLDKKNEDRSRYIGLCNRRSVVGGRQRWVIEASSVPLKVLEQNRKEL